MKKKTFILLWVTLSAVLCACSKNDGPSRPVRSEYVKVYETSPDKLVDGIQVPFAGAQDAQIHILSNVPLQWKYMVSQNAAYPDWFKITRVEEVEAGHIVVTYDAESILTLNNLLIREGKLSFSNPGESLGKFLSVRQGYKRQFLDEFSDEPDQMVTLTGKQTYTTKDYSEVNRDYFDYISFNAWAETTNEFRSKNITLDITISGGLFFDTGLTTFRVNVPLADAADKSNFKYLLVMGEGARMSPNTHFTFSVANDDLVFVHIDNLAAYQVTEADLGLYIDIDFDEDEEPDWV
jgi:hypothetical protein